MKMIIRPEGKNLETFLQNLGDTSKKGYSEKLFGKPHPTHRDRYKPKFGVRSRYIKLVDSTRPPKHMYS